MLASLTVLPAVLNLLHQFGWSMTKKRTRGGKPAAIELMPQPVEHPTPSEAQRGGSADHNGENHTR